MSIPFYKFRFLENIHKYIASHSPDQAVALKH